MARPVFLIIAGSIIFFTACGTLPDERARAVPSGLSVELKGPPVLPTQMLAAPAEPSCTAVGCHRAPGSIQTVSMHPPFATQQCTFCHGADVHEAKLQLSATDTIALCHACHSAASLGPSHPMGVGVIDPNTGEMVVCITCHSPHYSDYTDQLRLDGHGELCAQCHTDMLTTD